MKKFDNIKCRGSHLEVFLEKGVLKISSKLTGKVQFQSKITLQHERFPVNLQHIFRTRLPKSTSDGCFLHDKEFLNNPDSDDIEFRTEQIRQKIEHIKMKS